MSCFWVVFTFEMDCVEVLVQANKYFVTKTKYNNEVMFAMALKEFGIRNINIDCFFD